MKAIPLSIILVIFLVCVSKGSYSQESKVADTVDNKFYISISPAGLIDALDGSSVRISADAKITTRIAISAEAGFYTSLGNVFSVKDDTRGILIKPAVKYYFNKKKILFGPYVALEYQYKHQDYRLSDSIRLDGMAPYARKNYGMTRHISCINAKYGQVSNLSKRIVFEWFVGAGIRFFNSVSELTQQEHDEILYGDGRNNSGEASLSRTVGKRIYPNFTAGVKFGLRII